MGDGLIHIAIVCEDHESSRYFVSQVASDPLRFSFYNSLGELQMALNRLERMPTGMVIDLDLSVSSTTQERVFLKETLEKKFATAFFNLSTGRKFSLSDPRNFESWKRFIQMCRSTTEGDLRRHPRVKTYVPILVSWDGGHRPLKAFTGDMSEGGCFVMSPDSPMLGTEVEIDFNAGAQKMVGRVAWVRPLKAKSDVPPGFGIEIRFRKESERQAFAALV
jgi:hypothetical protein